MPQASGRDRTSRRNEANREYPMDVTKILEHDHREAESLFEKIAKADGADRQPFIDELNTALRAHMELEERVVYPAMEPVTGAEEVQEGKTEHASGAMDWTRCSRWRPTSPVSVPLESLKAGISHHVEEEETEVFPTLRKEGSKILDDIATPFMRERIELGMPVTAAALRRHHERRAARRSQGSECRRGDLDDEGAARGRAPHRR